MLFRSLSGTYGGSPISATVSGTSVKPSGPTDTTPPTIQSINRLTPSTEFTTATTLTWRVTFSEDVQNVDVGDFGLRDVPTGVVTGGLNLSLTPIDARAYNLTAQFTRNSSALDGYVEVGNRGGGIEDLAGNTLANTINSQPYRYDTTPPTISIGSFSPGGSGTFTAPVTLSDQIGRASCRERV